MKHLYLYCWRSLIDGWLIACLCMGMSPTQLPHLAKTNTPRLLYVYIHNTIYMNLRLPFRDIVCRSLFSIFNSLMRYMLNTHDMCRINLACDAFKLDYTYLYIYIYLHLAVRRCPLFVGVCWRNQIWSRQSMLQWIAACRVVLSRRRVQGHLTVFL